MVASKNPRKIRMDEHRAEAALREFAPRPHLYLLLDNVRSIRNVGSLFRAADGFGVRKVFLTGITPTPPRPEIAKIALGAEKSVESEWMEDPLKAFVILRNMGVRVVAVEQTTSSVPIYDFDFPHPLCLVFGHELVGVDDDLLSRIDDVVDVPMFGAKHSHNVATSIGIVLSEVRRQWRGRDLNTAPTGKP